MLTYAVIRHANSYASSVPAACLTELPATCFSSAHPMHQIELLCCGGACIRQHTPAYVAANAQQLLHQIELLAVLRRRMHACCICNKAARNAFLLKASGIP